MSSRKRRILCVEDHQEMCELITIFLSAYEVHAVPTMADALRVIEAEAFDLYILDNWLEDGSGVALCRHIRASDAHTSIIFISAAVREEDQQEALAAGAQAYLTKPLDAELLTRTVAELLRQTEVKNLEARLAEVTTIRDSITERLARAESSLQLAKETALQLAAQHTFFAAGGTRAGFERMWPTVYKEEVSVR